MGRLTYPLVFEPDATHPLHQAFRQLLLQQRTEQGLGLVRLLGHQPSKGIQVRQ